MHLSPVAGIWASIPVRVSIVVLLRIAVRVTARLRVSLRSSCACCDTRTALTCTYRYIISINLHSTFRLPC